MRDLVEIAGPAPRRLEGRHVLALLLAFFGVVFAVNGYFLVRALSTHSGVVAVEPYRKGLAYNQRIAADERQTALGWSDRIDAARDGQVTVAIIGRDGQPVPGLHITGSIGRPSTGEHDRRLVLREQTSGGHKMSIGVLPAGAWIIAIEARVSPDTEPVYRARRRLWLKS